MIQMPESQMGSLRMRPSQLRIEMTDDQQPSTRRRNFMSPTALPLFQELQQQTTRQNLQQPIAPLTLKMSSQSQITKSLLFNIFLQGFFINYYGYVFWQYSFRYVLLQLWIQDLFTIFILIYFNYRKQEECIWQLIETMFLFFLKVFIVFYYEIQKFKIYFVTIMMISLSILVLLMRVVQKLKFQLQNNQQIIVQFIKTLLCVQITLIALKWEEKQTGFGPRSLQFCGYFWSSLHYYYLSLLQDALRHSQISQKQTNQNYLIGNIWIFINIIGYTLLPFTFLYRLTQLYDNQESFGEDETIQLIVLSGIFMVLITIYTTFLQTILSKCESLPIRMFLKELQGFESYSAGIPQQPIQIQQEQEQRIYNLPDSNEILSKRKERHLLGLLSQMHHYIQLKCHAPSLLFLISQALTRRMLNKRNNFLKGHQDNNHRTEWNFRRKLKRIAIQQIIRLIIQKCKIQKVNIEELAKENVQSKDISEEPDKSNKNQNSINEDQQSIQDKCLICYENQPNILFIPCRHGGICQKCAEDVVLKSNQCYLCRKNIQQILRIKTEGGQLVVNEISHIKQKRQIQE